MGDVARLEEMDAKIWQMSGHAQQGSNQILRSGIHTQIWTAPRLENTPELLVIPEQVAHKYSSNWNIWDNAEMAVNQKVSHPCSGPRAVDLQKLPLGNPVKVPTQSIFHGR